MLRSVSIPILVVFISGCAGGSGSPGKLPEGATGGMYSTGEPQMIASCIANAVHNAVRPVGDRLVVDSVRYPGVSYSVGQNQKSVYTTQIAVMGDAGDTEEAKNVGLCASANVSGG